MMVPRLVDSRGNEGIGFCLGQEEVNGTRRFCWPEGTTAGTGQGFRLVFRQSPSLSPLLDGSLPALRFQAALLRCSSRSRRPPLTRRYRGLVQQGGESREGILTISFLGPVAPGVDDQDAAAGDPSAGELEHSRADRIRQGWGVADVETKLGCRGDLVDVLAPWSGRTHEGDQHLAFIDRQGTGDADQCALHPLSMRPRLPRRWVVRQVVQAAGRAIGLPEVQGGRFPPGCAPSRA